ncbi:MAG: hypothetical protein AAFU64_03645 [Bacteroidota bacterium]
MKIIRLIIGVFIGLMAITFVAETIEFITVKLVTGSPFAELTQNPDSYFKVRNRTWILIFKIFYSLLGGLAGGYLATWISGKGSLLAIFILIGVQVLSLVWAGFLSELGQTGPTWMWIYLILVIPLGIWWGHRVRNQ